ncbi:unnamed protein product [Closterium sp. NIES-65]|nr:unnamed protein product [Closterium sp. NIES-65]
MAPQAQPRAAPPMERTTVPPAQTKAAAVTKKKKPATATIEAAGAASMVAIEAPVAPVTVGPEPRIARTAGQATEMAGEGGGGERIDPGPLDADESARGETDKSAHEAQTNRRAPEKNRRQKPRPQQHQRRLGEGLAPARPGPLVGWTHQADPPQAVAEVEGGADQSSPLEIAGEEAEAQEERESAAEEAEERRAAARRGCHQGGTNRQQALREQANRRAEGRPPETVTPGAAARGARGRGRGRGGGLGNLLLPHDSPAAAFQEPDLPRSLANVAIPAPTYTES